MKYSYWKLKKVFALCLQGRIKSVNEAIENILHGKHRLFSHDISIEVLSAFISYVLNIEAAPTGQSSYAEGPILVLEGLDALKLIVLFCISDSQRDTTGGHRQKYFHDTLTHVLHKAIMKPIWTIEIYEWK